MIFTEHDHARLATLFDGMLSRPETPDVSEYERVPYPGYKPEVREAPNGDTKACPACAKKTGEKNHPPGMMFVGFVHNEAISLVRELLGVGWQICPTCAGSGRVPNEDAEGVCGVCHGAPYHEDDCVHSFACGCKPNPCCPGCKGSGRAGAKRYLHVALKYKPPAWAEAYLARAHWEASKVAEALGVRKEYFPMPADGTLRVLEYPPGAGSVEHTDFDLFSIVLWRSTPDDLERDLAMPEPADLRRRFDAERLSPGLHIGEIGELVGLGPATPHRVPPRPYAQKSIVYFAMPDHAARLQSPDVRATDGLTVGEWLAERMARSRYT